MRIILVDHQDSFTYNLFHDLGVVAGTEPKVIDSREVTAQSVGTLEGDPVLVVLSAGPGHPAREDDSGGSLQLIRDLIGRVPIFGVCFGLQLIVHALGGRIVEARRIVHGRSLPVHHRRTGLFRCLPSPVSMMRYHSLVAERRTLPADLVVTAESAEGEVMAIEHRRLPIWAVQFHPESVGSPQGRILLENVVMAARGAPAAAFA